MSRAAQGNFAALALALIAHGAGAADLTIEVRDSTGNAVTDAVVYVEPANGAAPAAQTVAHATIDQVNKEFVPRVSIVRAGTEVSFPNSDNIRHSIYSFSPAKVFTTKLYAGRGAPPVLFDKTGLVVLGCNIHDTMVAWVYIVDTPWFARSGADGAGTIKGLPAGDYRVTAAAPAHRLAPTVRDVHVGSDNTLRQILALQPGP